jgi:hypothetical protein
VAAVLAPAVRLSGVSDPPPNHRRHGAFDLMLRAAIPHRARDSRPRRGRGRARLGAARGRTGAIRARATDSCRAWHVKCGRIADREKGADSTGGVVMWRLPRIGTFDFKRLLWLGLCVPLVLWSGPDLVRPPVEPPEVPLTAPNDPRRSSRDADPTPTFDADAALDLNSGPCADPKLDSEIGALPTGGAAAKATLPPRGAPSHRQDDVRPAAAARADAARAVENPPAERRAPAPLAGHAAAAARWPGNSTGVALGCGGCRGATHAHGESAHAPLPAASIDREVFVTALRLVTR